MMKKLTTLLVSLTLLIACLPAALAEGASFEGKNIPTDVKQYFAADSFNGYTIGLDATLQMDGTAAGGYYFAVTQCGGHNVLHGFQRKNGRWEHFLRTDRAIPQGEGTFALSNQKGKLHLLSDQTLSLSDTLAILFTLADNEEQGYAEEFFEVGKSGVWTLKLLCCDSLWCEVLVGKDSLTYYAEGEKKGTAKGALQTDLRYFSFAAFPKSLKDAKNKLSSPPQIPASAQLKATNVKFTGGKQYAVYSGPGEKFLRAANGKALVSTNDWIQVFGIEDNWALIQYDITSDHLRFGWIPASALPANAGVGQLHFDDLAVTVLRDVAMTDDPLKSQSELVSFRRGQQITYLAAMGDWAYVQDDVNWVRGFVPLSAISFDTAPTQRTSQAYVGEYSARAAAQLWNGGATQVTVTVSGPRAWLTKPEILYYQVYANNLYQDVAELTENQADGDRLATLTYQAGVNLPAGVSVIGLCPVYADGVHTQEAVTIFVGT